MSLLNVTKTLLEKRIEAGTSLRQIARESDGTVEYEWLAKFSQGKVDDPGVNRVQALHDCLAKKQKSAAA
jgi:hypothetical protein